MKIISRTALRVMLFNVRGAKPVTIVARTKPTLTGGKKCPYAGVEKVSRTNCMINWSYENAVNNQREREGNTEEFVSKPRKWGRRLYEIVENAFGTDSRTPRISTNRTRHLPFVAKNWTEDTITAEQFNEIPIEELYLEMKVQKSLDYVYILNGKEIPAEEIEPYLPPRKDSGRQEVEKEIILRDYTFTNIEEIAIDGELYKVA